jgi:type I restriction enzyme S subunit
MGVPVHKIITERTFAELKKEAEIPPLPETWTVEPLKSLFSREPSNGLYLPQSDYGRGTLILRIDDFGNEGDIVTTARNRVNADESVCSQFSLARNDIVVNRVNSLSHLGKTALIGEIAEPMLFESNMMRFRVDEERIRPEFAFRVLNSAVCKSQIISLAKRAVAQSSVNQGDVASIEIPLPGLDEQRQIAAVLLAVQRAIEWQEQLIALTKELKNALMHKLFSEGLSEKSIKQTEIGSMPAAWSLKCIGELGKCVTGTTPSTKVDQYYSPHDYCFVSPADMGQTKYIATSEKMVSKAGLGAARALSRASVLCVCIGSSIGKTGMTYHQESCTNQQINAIVVNHATNPDFVYYLLSHWSDYWKAHATFGPIPILSKGAFEKIRIPFTVDRDEQDQIADALSAADAKIEHHARHRVVFTSLFRTLVHQLVTAQIRVHALDLSALRIETETVKELTAVI